MFYSNPDTQSPVAEFSLTQFSSCSTDKHICTPSRCSAKNAAPNWVHYDHFCCCAVFQLRLFIFCKQIENLRQVRCLILFYVRAQANTFIATLVSDLCCFVDVAPEPLHEIGECVSSRTSVPEGWRWVVFWMSCSIFRTTGKTVSNDREDIDTKIQLWQTKVYEWYLHGNEW